MEALTDHLMAMSRPGAAASERLEWMILTNGDTDPFDSVILLGFGASGGDPLYAAKVPRRPQNGRLLEVEYRRLRELWELMGPAAAATLPKPIAYVEPDGQPVLVLGYVSGSTLLKAAGRGFWADQPRVLQLVREAAHSLRTLNERASVPLAPGERVPLGLDLVAGRFRELFVLSTEEEAALAAIIDGLPARTGGATHKVLLQGDFWHGNLIRSAETRKLVFIDWQYARWTQDVSIDVYLFVLAAAFTAAPYGSAQDRARGAASVLSSWQKVITPAYLQAYGSPENFVLLKPREGMLTTCVEKAVRPAIEYGYSHPDDLMWRYLFAELVSWPEQAWELSA
jgi:aminoglycoside phosphotransferase (APT) family kinase protein